MQVTAKEVTDGRKIAHIRARGFFPRAFAIRLRRQARRPLHIEHADLRMVRGGDLSLGLARLFHRPLHVRLAGAEPYLTHQHIFDRDRVLPGHHEVHGHGIRVHRVQCDGPFSRGVGQKAMRLLSKGQFDLLADVCRAPDACELKLLQHHAVRKHGGQFHLGMQAGGQQKAG